MHCACEYAFVCTHRTVYLVIDGGFFYAYDYLIPNSRHRTYVPMSIFGEYYITEEEKLYQGNRPIQRIDPSPYCNRMKIFQRLKPMPPDLSSRAESVMMKGKFVEIPETGHYLSLHNQELKVGKTVLYALIVFICLYDDIALTFMCI